MSRHTLIREPNREIVVGFDPPLRAFFGQRFDPSRPADQDEPVAGWPSPRGLGIQPRIESRRQADLALLDLGVWLSDQHVPHDAWARVADVLWNEWLEAPDRGEPFVSRIIRDASGGTGA